MFHIQSSFLELEPLPSRIVSIHSTILRALPFPVGPGPLQPDLVWELICWAMSSKALTRRYIHFTNEHRKDSMIQVRASSLYSSCCAMGTRKGASVWMTWLRILSRAWVTVSSWFIIPFHYLLWWCVSCAIVMQLKRNERTRLSRSTHSLTHYRRGKFKSQLRSIALLSITNIAHSHSASRLRFPNTVIQNLAWLINQSITHSMNFFASGGRVGFFSFSFLCLFPFFLFLLGSWFWKCR